LTDQTYQAGSDGLPLPSHGSALVPSSRMCHTITDVGDSGALLVGGRASPDNALADCWFYHKWLHAWERVDDLPWPLYRHRAVPLGRGCVLISTGRVDSRHISQEYLVWSRRLGWVECVSNESITPPAAFGAVFVATDRQAAGELPSRRQGVLAGGMCSDAILLEEVWQWELEDFSGPVSAPMQTTQSTFFATIRPYAGELKHYLATNPPLSTSTTLRTEAPTSSLWVQCREG